MAIEIETNLTTGLIPFKFVREGRPTLRVVAKSISDAEAKFEAAWGFSPAKYELQLGF